MPSCWLISKGDGAGSKGTVEMMWFSSRAGNATSWSPSCTCSLPQWAAQKKYVSRNMSKSQLNMRLCRPSPIGIHAKHFRQNTLNAKLLQSSPCRHLFCSYRFLASNVIIPAHIDTHHCVHASGVKATAAPAKLRESKVYLPKNRDQNGFMHELWMFWWTVVPHGEDTRHSMGTKGALEKKTYHSLSC